MISSILLPFSPINGGTLYSNWVKKYKPLSWNVFISIKFSKKLRLSPLPFAIFNSYVIIDSALENKKEINTNKKKFLIL